MHPHIVNISTVISSSVRFLEPSHFLMPIFHTLCFSLQLISAYNLESNVLMIRLWDENMTRKLKMYLLAKTRHMKKWHLFELFAAYWRQWRQQFYNTISHLFETAGEWGWSNFYVIYWLHNYPFCLNWSQI